jgi:cytidine deaminase
LSAKGKTSKPKAAKRKPGSRKSATPIDWDALVAAAASVRERAHAPYSDFFVGAAVLCKSGRVFIGCNVENASFGATICAERGAVMQMVAAGERDPIACAVVTKGKAGAPPCGMCRQVLAEFASDLDFVLVGVHKGKESRRFAKLAELLPEMFRL